jgi:predicted amidohydrolase
VQALRVIGYQFDLAWEDAARNVAMVEAWLLERRPQPGSLVVLPEMFSSGFTMNPGAVAQPEQEATETRMADWARQYGVWLVGGLAVRQSDRSTNEAVVVGPDGRVTVRYRKQRPFTPGGETSCYAAGHEPVVFDWNGLRVAPFICYDLRFPELFREATARWRPELYVVIASWPDKRVSHWLRLLQARAIEGQAYVLGVNRTGSDPSHRYPGRSVVVDPMGEIVADAGPSAGVAEAMLDLPTLREYRSKLPFLDDQRPASRIH